MLYSTHLLTAAFTPSDPARIALFHVVRSPRTHGAVRTNRSDRTFRPVAVFGEAR